MSWTRLDDGWTDQQLLADLPHETRWHYLCMIQFCSRTKRFDGFIRGVDARRCSDVENPATANRELADLGLISPADGGYIVNRMQEEHAPPVWVQKRTESNKEAQRRHRAHESGDHRLCLPKNCKDANRDADSHADSKPDKEDEASIADSHADVSADSRTGQDRLRTNALVPEEEKTSAAPEQPRSKPTRNFPECAVPDCDGRLNQKQMDKDSRVCMDCDWLGRSAA